MDINDEIVPWIISNKIPRNKYRIYQNKNGFYIKRKVFQGWIKVKELVNFHQDKFECKNFATQEIASEYITRLCTFKFYILPNQFINKLSIILFIIALLVIIGNQLLLK